jgi:O-antigen/teichoic acid export membrane protein
MLKKENIIFLLFSMINITIGLIATYLLSNYFSTEDFGKIHYLLTLTGVGAMFYLSGFDITIQKQIFNKNDEIVGYVLKKIMPLSLVLLVISVVILSVYVEKNIELILYATVIVAIGLFDKSNAILNSKLLFKQLRYLELFAKLMLLTLAISIVFYSYTVESYFIFFTIVSVFILLFRIFYTRKYLNIKVSKEKDYQDIKEEGFKNTVSTSYGNLTNWSEKLILGILDVNLLAIFVIGQLFPKVIKDNVKVILIPTLNTWASKGFNHYTDMIRKYTLTLWLMGILMFLLIYFMVDIIISNYFIKYEESILIAQLLSITLVFKFVESIKMSSMALSKHTNIFNKINNITNTFKIILVSSLIPFYEIYGAVLVILIVDIFKFLLITIEYAKLIKGEKI